MRRGVGRLVSYGYLFVGFVSGGLRIRLYVGDVSHVFCSCIAEYGGLGCV